MSKEKKQIMKLRKLLSYIVGMQALVAFSLLLSISVDGSPRLPSAETLNYTITYKWGLIHKDAATACLSIKEKGDNYDIMLTARTKPWADKIFMVRDTLKSKVKKNGFKPYVYEKISHEGGKYLRDVVSYSYSGNNVAGHCTRERAKGKDRGTTTTDIQASGITFDMLSVFYYLRTIDFEAVKPAQELTMNIFSGSKSERLTVKKLGVESVKLRNGKTVNGMKISFKFTTKGKKQSSDPIECWLTTDGRNVPLMMVGKLPIGQVRVYLD